MWKLFKKTNDIDKQVESIFKQLEKNGYQDLDILRYKSAGFFDSSVDYNTACELIKSVNKRLTPGYICEIYEYVDHLGKTKVPLIEEDCNVSAIVIKNINKK